MLEKSFDIGKRHVGNDGDLFVVAEAGSNFNQSLDTAKKLIDVAAAAGTDAVKFQLFSADVLYPDGGRVHEQFKALELNPAWVPILADHAADQGVEFMASAFDAPSIQTLNDVGVPAHKMASSETTNLRLIRKMAQTGKPLIISTGMCNLSDIVDAVSLAQVSGCSQIALMQCGSVYPLQPEDVHLRVLDTFRSIAACPVGFSDHTLGIAAALAAVGRGASIIEKHFTLDRNSVGPDHFYALEPAELSRLILNLREASMALGSSEKVMLSQERKVGRRLGLYAANKIEAGRVILRSDLVARRPALGIDARFIEVVAGSTSLKDVSKDQPMSWQMVGD